MWDEGIEGEGHWIGLMPWVDVCRHLPPGLSSYALDWLQNPSRRAWERISLCTLSLRFRVSYGRSVCSHLRYVCAVVVPS